MMITWKSPNGVSHLIPDMGPCATCGRSHKEDLIIAAIADELLGLAGGDARKAQALAILFLPNEKDGAWQCGNGHMFRYEPPPSWPPWCQKTDCRSVDFRWIVRDEVTGADWLPDEPVGFGEAAIPEPSKYGQSTYSEDWK